MVISQVNSKNNIYQAPPSANQKITPSSNALERATLSSATSGESKSCFQAIIDFFSSLLNTIKNLLCCQNSQQKPGLSEEDIVISSKTSALTDQSEDKITIIYDRKGLNEANHLKTTMVESRISDCKFKKILVSAFRDTENRTFFADVDGRHGRGIYQKTINEWAGSVLMLGIELDPRTYIPTSQDFQTQEGFQEFLDKKNAFIMLSKDEYSELVTHKMPERLAKLL